MKSFDPTAKYKEVDFWVRKEGEDLYSIGVTDFGQEFFRDLTSVELPEVGETLSADTPFCQVESAKVSTELISPLSGVVVEVNSEILVNPNMINKSPYGKGWLIKLSSVPVVQFENLSTSTEYQNNISQFFNK